MVDATDLKSVGCNGRAGSSPVLGTRAPLAQKVEQMAFNHWVRGSNPLGRTISGNWLIKKQEITLFFYIHFCFVNFNLIKYETKLINAITKKPIHKYGAIFSISLALFKFVFCPNNDDDSEP